jgi:hypothetical protein
LRGIITLICTDGEDCALFHGSEAVCRGLETAWAATGGPAHDSLQVQIMKHARQPLETVTSLLTAPSAGFAVDGSPDTAILHIGPDAPGWAVGLEAATSGCLVLGFKKILLDLEEAGVSTSFEIACIVSSWKLLIDAGGTLALCGLSAASLEELKRLSEPTLFNTLRDVDAGIDWIELDYERFLVRAFPRKAKCVVCGTEGHVAKRGEHVCDGCGMIYLVTERGELQF